jgi:hypothetical protein
LVPSFLLSSVKVFFLFFRPFSLFFLNVLLSFLLLLNWFLFLSSFVFPLLFRHYFIPVSLALVISSLAYPNFLGTKMLGCCYYNNSFLSKCFTHLHVDFLFAKSHVLCCLFYKISPRGILISPGPGMHFHWY